MNESIVNAYKYAFRNMIQGDLLVCITREPDESIKVEVRDNGNGLPEDFDMDRNAGSGLNIARVLVEQLGGTLTAGKSNGESVFSFSFYV